MAKAAPLEGALTNKLIGRGGGCKEACDDRAGCHSGNGKARRRPAAPLMCPKGAWWSSDSAPQSRSIPCARPYRAGMVPSGAHLFALPNKINLAAEQYFIV